MRIAALAALALPILLALPATAQRVADQNAARGQLFGDRTVVSIQRHGFLTQGDIATLQAMPRVADLKYYGAMAAAPGAGLQAETTTGAFNYHSPARARAAALQGCEAKRRGGAACVIVADVLPRGFRPGQALTLNQDASRAVNGRALRRNGGVLAASASTGAWALGPDAATARANCGQGDCQVVVAP
ncbi:hypothetical protein [Jannaschia sp. LMIT008]|uniref:hypothetical protein n=1 Tax=Jannaschia maritima TaxID=3032585 RepID=UPI0028126377|nr:hypothetical protein [Jannaschia sp. LMIT008]